MYSIDLPLENLIRKGSNTSSENPSIFFLHGFGSNMQDLYGLSQFFDKKWNCISLQASIPIQFNSWAWAEINPMNILELPQPEQMIMHYEKVIQVIRKCIDELNLDSTMVNILGFSQGASLAMYCGLNNPKMFNSVVSLCGYFPKDGITSHIDRDQVKNVNFFLGNATNDLYIPITMARDYRDNIISFGGEPNYNEYHSEHTISNECLNDFIKWLNI